MKKTIIFLSLFVTAFILLSATIRRSSSGAPASHTGAPGEKNCSTSGCHDDHKVNSGTAQLNISIENNVTQIEEGKTYLIKIKISDPNVTRFGFQVVALDEKTSENIGTFKIIDTLRTQTVKNKYGLLDRNYVTYTFEGTDAVSKGNGEWVINWVAPTTIKNKIVFYVSGVSANDDMTDKGDHTFTNSLTLSKTGNEK